MRVLVVDDDVKIRSFIENGLRQKGFSVDAGCDGEEAYGFLMAREYDAAVLDIMMPKLDGLTAIQRARAEGVFTPILILSAKHEVDDRITGLRAGGDDYLVKPFSFSELLARLESLIRRSKGRGEPTVYTVADLSMDVLKHEVRRGGKRIELQPREFALLLYLMRNAGRVVTKVMVMEHVWGYDFDPQTNVVEARVSRLREKIDRGFPVALLRTIRGVGYVIREEEH